MTDETDKTEDKKMIEIEEQMNILNNDAKTPETIEAANDATAAKPETRSEGMEVKPKKIPIGGIQMPGFFTRSKSKEKCKDGDGDHGDVEDAELLSPSNKKEESLISQARIKLPNPFRKSKVQEDGGEKGEGSGSKPEKKKFRDAIKLPLVSVKKKKVSENVDGQSSAAGATAENDTKDGMKNVPLDDKKDIEKQDSTESYNWKEKLKAYRIAISALLLFITVTIIVIAIICSGDEVQYSPPIINGKYIQTVTSCGKVEGILDDGGVAFRGIPYARPPLGELRFKPAQPLDNLEYCWPGNETLLTHNATDYCMQIYSNGTISGTEDCLTLDVVTPYVRYDNPLPVVVLIGAESLIGGSPGKMRPSARYARSKDVVFVRPNFRLGSLGFLALKTISDSVHPPTSGDYGLSDIVQALEWIQKNIEHFGGNKSHVTLFGHRAGATLVTALSTMTGAEKLFARAWATSGGALYPKRDLPESEKEHQAFLAPFECKSIQCLRNLSAMDLTKSIPDVWRKPQPDLPLKSENPDTRHEWLVLDGKYINEEPASRWTKEGMVKVQLVLGTTAHSAASDKLRLKNINWTEELIVKHVKDSLLSDLNLADQALNLYNKTYKGLTTMISDIRTVCPLYAISTQMHSVTFYVVTQTRGENDLADVESDVDAILGRYEPRTPEQRRYVSTMQQLFYHYVYHGEVTQQREHKYNKILNIGQDSLPESTYSECGFWIKNNVVPMYAQLD